MTSFSWWCVPWSKLFSLGNGHPIYIDCGQIIAWPMTNAIRQKNDLLQIEFPPKFLVLPLINKKNPSTNLDFHKIPKTMKYIICYIKCKLPGLVHQHESQPSGATFVCLLSPPAAQLSAPHLWHFQAPCRGRVPFRSGLLGDVNSLKYFSMIILHYSFLNENKCICIYIYVYVCIYRLTVVHYIVHMVHSFGFSESK